MGPHIPILFSMGFATIIVVPMNGHVQYHAMQAKQEILSSPTGLNCCTYKTHIQLKAHSQHMLYNTNIVEYYNTLS